VGDAKIYYEVYGKGDPLVLLHGGLFGSIDEFKGIIPDLSRDHLVIAIATRGHGKSELGTCPLSYRLLAEDFAAVIRNVTTHQVDVIGFSDGAIAAYHLTAAHPEMVKRLIAVGGPLGLYGYNDSGLADLDKYDTPEELEKLAPEFVGARKKSMPDETAWNRFIEELAKMWKQREYISREQIQSIQCPTLIVGGDRDEYTKTEHFVEIYRLLPKGQLAIVPKSGHTVFGSKPDSMLKLVRDFLKG
jgi:pimeloyl-ACP methyl ester carboxylesterase